MVTNTVMPDEPDAALTLRSKTRPSQASMTLPEVLLVVLAVEELAPQQTPSLVTGGVQGRGGGEHQSGRIPARPSSSTSYASLRMRWST